MLLWLTQTALAAEAPAKPDVAVSKLNYIPLLRPHPRHPRFPKASPLLGGDHPFQKDGVAARLPCGLCWLAQVAGGSGAMGRAVPSLPKCFPCPGCVSFPSSAEWPVIAEGPRSFLVAGWLQKPELLPSVWGNSLASRSRNQNELGLFFIFSLFCQHLSTQTVSTLSYLRE